MSKDLERLPRERPSAVLFDLDDTLYAYEPAHRAGIEATREFCEIHLGLNATRFATVFAEARASVKSRLEGRAASHDRLLYFGRLIEACTGKSDASMSLRLDKTYWRNFLSKMTIFPSARVLIDELRYAGIPMAVVTDLTTQIQLRKLVYSELGGSFDAVVTSEEVGADKPDPRNFELALQKLGVANHETGDARSSPIWMIGDSNEKDILGAKSAVGAFAIQKLHGRTRPSPEADLQVDDFGRLADVVRERFAKFSDPSH
jgi:putative hydrolase of the HAD superfamily